MRRNQKKKKEKITKENKQTNSEIECTQVRGGFLGLGAGEYVQKPHKKNWGAKIEPAGCRQKLYCRSHSKCPCGAPGAPGFLGAVFFCSCLIKGESRVHNLAICSFFWGSVVVWVLMGGEGGEKDVDCPIGW